MIQKIFNPRIPGSIKISILLIVFFLFQICIFAETPRKSEISANSIQLSKKADFFDLATPVKPDIILRSNNIPFPQGKAITMIDNKIPGLTQVHFYDREKFRTGYFITEEDFKNRGLLYIQDIFSNVPGIIINGNGIYMTRYIGSSTTAPQPLIYIDGFLMPEASNLNPDPIGWLQPEDFLAAEIYTNANAPVEYSRNKIGGVILIWTK